MDKISLKNKPREYIEHLQRFKNNATAMRQVFGPGTQTFTYSNTTSKPLTINKSLSQLKLISINQMQIETVHYGRYIKLRFMCHCFKQNAIIGLCEDHTEKNCIELSILNFDLKGEHFDHYFSENTVIYVKEPYYKIARSGTKIIRIDNSYDIVFEKEALRMLQGETSQSKIDPKKQELQKDRLKGVQLMKNNEYVDAYVLYTHALNKCQNNEDKIKFLLNKAIVCSKLNLKQQYQQNIDSVLKLDQKHQKAIYHKIKCLILRQKYEQAQQYQQTNRDILSEDAIKDIKHFKQYNKRTRQNRVDWFRAIQFQELGEYFSPKIAIGKSPYGLGIIAKSKIKKGEVIIIQRPLISTGYFFTSDPNADIAGFVLKQKMQQLYKNSSEFRSKCKVLSTPERIQFQKGERQDMKIQSYLEIEGVVNANSFGLFDLETSFNLKQSSTRKGAVLYEKISMINHSCQANCTRINIGDTMVISAVEEINQNEQIYISYMRSIDHNYRCLHLIQYGIKCECIYCKEQVYQLKNGKAAPNGKSKQLKKQKISESFVLDRKSEQKKKRMFEECWEIADVAGLLWITGDEQLAAKTLRRVFPMSIKESRQIIKMYWKK